MKKVMVFGTFDIFHKGHENFLKQARQHGEFLFVVVARDKTILNVKKQKAVNSEQDRLKIIKKSKLVGMAILGNINNKYSAVKKYKPDVICLGYDQTAFVKDLKKKLKELGLDKTVIFRLKSYYPKKYKSSILKQC